LRQVGELAVIGQVFHVALALPEELFFSHLQQHYPHLFSGRPLALDGDFQAEAGQDEGRR
ncbi:hypothetical protein NTA42_05620, partial [Pseudomonas aeruginosa]|nr:hypothetical protein [Pseudomonas aeruginosa]